MASTFAALGRMVPFPTMYPRYVNVARQKEVFHRLMVRQAS